MKRRTIALTALAGLTLAHAPTASAATAPPMWAVDQRASELGFSASMGGQAIPGHFRRWNARIAFDPANLAASSVIATIDIASVTTGDQTRDEALPTADWFDAKRFPQAVFRSRRIVAAGPGRFIASGDLSLRGVTRPVVLPFALNITGDTAHMKGALMLDRSIFGVGQGQFAGGDTVALKVSVSMAITARRAPAR